MHYYVFLNPMVDPLWPKDRAKIETKTVLRLTNCRSVTKSAVNGVNLTYHVETAYSYNSRIDMSSFNPMVDPLWPADRAKIEKNTILRPK
jgi:hypothetical protein